MFVIEIDNRRLLDDFANFLEYKLPGVVTRGDDHLAVIIHGTLAPATQKRILQRLLWAWRVERKIKPPATARLTYRERAHAKPF